MTSSLLRDMAYACRVIARDRTYSTTVVLTLAICIGANAAIFTVVNAVVLRPLPFSEPGRLLHVSNAYPGASIGEADNSVPDYYDRKAGVGAFEEVALYRRQGRTVGATNGAERVQVMEATPSLLRLLGVRTHRGRLFAEQDAEPGQAQKVVLSYAFWQQQFGGRDEAMGKTLRLNGTPHVVIGVLPQAFVFLTTDVRLWIPLAFSPNDRSDDRRHSNNFQMIARLRAGATAAQAQQQIDAINAAQLARSPIKQLLIDAGFTTTVTPFQDRVVQEVRMYVATSFGVEWRCCC